MLSLVLSLVQGHLETLDLPGSEARSLERSWGNRGEQGLTGLLAQVDTVGACPTIYQQCCLAAQGQGPGLRLPALPGSAAALSPAIARSFAFLPSFISLPLLSPSASPLLCQPPSLHPHCFSPLPLLPFHSPLLPSTSLLPHLLSSSWFLPPALPSPFLSPHSFFLRLPSMASCQ